MSTAERSTCHIWWAAVPGAAQHSRHLLSEVELNRFGTLRQAGDQDRFVAGRALLRTLAAGLLGTAPERVAVAASCPDCPRPHGKPTLVGTGWEVSLSHAGAWVAVALTSGGPVGVDVEEIDASLALKDLASHVFAEAEPAAGGAEPSPLSFFRTWTRKEAVLKATGNGLRTPMSALAVSDAASAPALTAFTGRPDLVERVRLADLRPAPGYAAAVAVIAPGAVEFVDHGALDLGSGTPREGWWRASNLAV
ncbi:4'-phosphopantetheinyl transferase family protein [Streptomyces boluensis]|uniref:4'-phosphopantetheinyl transferase superfamily protein n=1 Tax=Streptomyces boluensis TaxID=1775135 RepID=A0A964UQ41_9ACTN|nr:4'-phosphopantetheinyl transferase superfamily protein [Streptomyces boluensis]NBE51943.1 4'-phosphopantetheinyl transferase superfamily protein [Streptomyces boluensis]